jgi:hypothetical protein
MNDNNAWCSPILRAIWGVEGEKAQSLFFGGAAYRRAAEQGTKSNQLSIYMYDNNAWCSPISSEQTEGRWMKNLNPFFLEAQHNRRAAEQGTKINHLSIFYRYLCLIFLYRKCTLRAWVKAQSLFLETQNAAERQNKELKLISSLYFIDIFVSASPIGSALWELGKSTIPLLQTDCSY